MARAPLVSIVVPCHLANEHQARLFEETLDTICAQTCGDYEVIVTDDGSAVDVSRIASGRPHAIVVRQPNRGPAAARNTGIARSRGRYFVFLDSDDHLLPPALETGLGALTDHPDCGFVVGAREEMTFEGLPVPWNVPVPPSGSEIYRALLAFDWYIIPPSSVMFRREVVEAIGGFRDPWGADDLDFYLRAAYRFKAWCYQAPAVTRYRRYSTSSSRDGERMLQSVRAVYDRQLPVVHGHSELEAAFHQGRARLTEIFLDCLLENISDRLEAGDRHKALRSAQLLAVESPRRWQALVAAGDPALRSIVHEIEVPRGGDGSRVV